MIRVYKVTDDEARGPGLHWRVRSVSECKKTCPELMKNGVVLLPMGLAEMLDIAYNEGIRANQRDIKRSLGI